MSPLGMQSGSSTMTVLPNARRRAACRASPELNGSTLRMISSAGPSMIVPWSVTTSTWLPSGLCEASASRVAIDGTPSGGAMTTTVAVCESGSSSRDGTDSTSP